MSDNMQARQLPIAPSVTEVARGEKRVVEIAEEQLAYAKLLDRGMKVGILFLIVSFTLYASGLLAPHVPVADLPKYWGMPVKQYLAATGIHPGWSWVGLVGQGDFSNFIGIAFLSGITIACYLAIIPSFLRKRDLTYAVIAILEVLVLTLAASGLLQSGGH